LKKDNIAIEYILALLNSKLYSFVYKTLFGGMHMGGGYLRYRTTFLNYLPLIFTSKQNQKLINKLVHEVMDLHKKIEMKKDKEDLCKNLILKTDEIEDNIDRLIYQMYKIDENEKQIIQENYSAEC
jgi:hypothetical protein